MKMLNAECRGLVQLLFNKYLSGAERRTLNA